MYKRIQKFIDCNNESFFLWGPRQVGKSTLLKEKFPNSLYYDLLLSNEFNRLIKKPSLLREEILASEKNKQAVIIDEIQKIPILLDEVQWMMVNKGIRFILCGSSARKLKRNHGNLLGGRALRYELYPLVSKEINNFDLLKALNSGLIPRHYLAQNHQKLLESYIGDYLREEINSEALTRNVPIFSHFLKSAAFSNGEIINFHNIASDCGISVPTVKNYFSILEDTLLARFIPSYRAQPKRRVIKSPKFYFFDLGIVNSLLKRKKIEPGTELFGRALEHFILQELIAYSHYSDLNYDISYWRTASGIEVDFILGQNEVVIEVKGSEVKNRHLKGLKAFNEEYQTKKSIIVSMDPRPRLISDIKVLPVIDFLNLLWNGDIIK